MGKLLPLFSQKDNLYLSEANCFPVDLIISEIGSFKVFK